MTTIHEIADGIFRISTCVPGITPDGFTFNQFLVKAEEPLLFHTGPRALFGSVSDAVSRLVPIERLRWVTFGHVEADECGSMNQWLAASPGAQIAHGEVGVMVSLNDLADRAPRALKDGETLDLGGKRVRHLDTPHVPHGWEARVLFEETTQTLLCGDLFSAHRGWSRAHDQRHHRSCEDLRGTVSCDCSDGNYGRNDSQIGGTLSANASLDARFIL